MNSWWSFRKAFKTVSQFFEAKIFIQKFFTNSVVSNFLRKNKKQYFLFPKIKQNKAKCFFYGYFCTKKNVFNKHKKFLRIFYNFLLFTSTKNKSFFQSQSNLPLSYCCWLLAASGRIGNNPVTQKRGLVRVSRE